MSKYYRINEVLQLTSVSLRTLHYYDEINLLSPSYRTEGGHRLYSKEDLIKLQQILIFKFMGFSLKEIQKLLHGSTFSIHESLKMQASALQKEATRIVSISKLLNHLVDNIHHQEEIDWDKVFKIIETLQLNETDRQKWYEKYLTPVDLEEMHALFSHYSDEFWVDYHKRWADLFGEVKQHLHTDPESEIGLAFAKKWMALVDEVYAGKPELSQKLWNGYKAGIIPENQLPFDEQVIAYISKAYKKFR